MWLRYLMRLSFCGALVATPVAGLAIAQNQEPLEEQTPPEAPPVEEHPPPVPEGIEITEGSGFRYESRGRRDPFVSLALGFNISGLGPRPPGLNGMLI